LDIIENAEKKLREAKFFLDKMTEHERIFYFRQHASILFVLMSQSKGSVDRKLLLREARVSQAVTRHWRTRLPLFG